MILVGGGPCCYRNKQMLFSSCLVVCVVLADPHKKAIYDTTGIKGLETDGWEVLNIKCSAFYCNENTESVELLHAMACLPQSLAVDVSISVLHKFVTYVDLCVINLQLVARTKTPQEILEEFERLEREKNERRLQQQTNPKVRFLCVCYHQ